MNIKTLSIASVLVTVASAQANLIQNGSFELSNLAPTGSFYTLHPGATNINNWAIINTGIGDSSIDYIGGYWQPSQGDWSIDLAGNSAGKIAQDVNLGIGNWYYLSFDLAGNPDGGPNAKVTVASAGGTSVSETFTVTGANTRPNMGWKTYGFYFQATSTRRRSLSRAPTDSAPTARPWTT